MHHRKVVMFVVALLIAGLWLTSGAYASSSDDVPWNFRSGTIANARSLPLGSHIYVDAEDIVNIVSHDALEPYILIAEPFALRDRAIVLTTPSPLLRLMQTVDIDGYVTRTASGDLAIENVTVWGYGDPETGQLLLHGPLIKGIFEKTDWPSMIDLTIYEQMQSAHGAAAVGETNEPNTNLPPPAKFYPTIASLTEAVTAMASRGAHSLDDGPSPPGGGTELPNQLTEFQCKQITSVGSEVIDSVTYEYLDIADDPPGNGALRAYYSRVDSAGIVTTDRINVITGQYIDSSGVLCVDSGPGFDDQSQQGIVQKASQGTIAWAKTFVDGTQLPASLTGLIVTTTSGDLPNALYVQAPDRRGGIRVLHSGSGINRGDIVTVSGKIDSGGDGERQIDTTDSGGGITVTSSGEAAPNPLGLTNRGLGGGDFNCYTPGIEGAAGLNDLGLLIKTWGVVTGIDQINNCFYVDDGSGIIDGSGLVGVMVSQWPDQTAITLPTQGSYITVTGISGCEDLGGNLVRTVRLRDSSDIGTVLTSPYSSLDLSLLLPTSNLNDVAKADRCNIRWACNVDSKGCGDQFTIPSSAGDYVIDTIRVWIVPSVPASPAYNLGDYFGSISLYTGTSSLSPALTGAFYTGTSATNSPHISFVRVEYQSANDEKEYQQADGTYNQIWQVDFNNLNWPVYSGTSYAFGVYAAPLVDRLCFLHGRYLPSQTTSSALKFDSTSGETTSVNGSGWFGGKLSDINVQIFAHPQ